jgi:hypothetical protein
VSILTSKPGATVKRRKRRNAYGSTPERFRSAAASDPLSRTDPSAPILIRIDCLTSAAMIALLRLLNLLTSPLNSKRPRRRHSGIK